jgi:hypothetical protein
VVEQQQGIIEQLPAGHYVSGWTGSYPGNPVLAALHRDDPNWVAMFAPFEDTEVVDLDIIPPN